MQNFIVSAADLTTFNVGDFQEGPELGNEPDPNRFYLEYLAMTNQVNRNFVEVTDQALEMMAAGYKKGLPLTINHMKGLFDTSLGIGQTIDAVVNQGNLYLQMYIAKNKTYNLDTIGDSEELIEAIKDGYIKRGSTSIRILEARCAVCDDPVEDFYGCEKHPKGRPIWVQNDSGENVEVVPHIIIDKAEPIEFSITMLRADPNSQVTRKNLNFYLDNIIDETIFNENFSGRTVEPLESSPTTITEDTAVTDKEKQALEAERDAEKRRADALQVSVDSLNSQLEVAKETITGLQAQVAENTILVQDGRDARVAYEDAYIEEFTAYVGETCSQEQQDAQRALIKDFNIGTLKAKTESMRDHNKRMYPEGRKLDDKPVETKATAHVDPD